jgi:hypothetical protein
MVTIPGAAHNFWFRLRNFLAACAVRRARPGRVSCDQFMASDEVANGVTSHGQTYFSQVRHTIPKTRPTNFNPSIAHQYYRSSQSVARAANDGVHHICTTLA